MRRSRIVFWLGEPSPHQSGYLTALADLLPQKDVVGVFQGQLQSERLALGWRTPDLGRLQAIMSPDPKTIEQIVLHEPEKTVHIFGGMRLPMVHRALRLCVHTPALTGVLSEARDWHGWSGKVRLLHSYLVERPYRNTVAFVLAIGHLGVRWYEKCGYPHARLFPLAYTTNRIDGRDTADGSHEHWVPDFRLVFVGQCIPRKGIDTLLKALSRWRPESWRLKIIGDGPLREKLERLAAQLGLAECVAFIGVKTNDEVRSILAETDLLVLPSRFDGWGSVVNEALMAGVSVVCSDRCGAADLVRASGFGETFHATSSDDLSKILHNWISKGRPSESHRREIRAWSKCIEGEAVARYIVAIIEHIDEGGQKPVAPWLAEARNPTADHNERSGSHVRTCG